MYLYPNQDTKYKNILNQSCNQLLLSFNIWSFLSIKYKHSANNNIWPELSPLKKEFLVNHKVEMKN